MSISLQTDNRIMFIRRLFFQLFAVITMASVFMSELFIYYIPGIFRSSTFYLALWIPIIAIFNFKLLLDKRLIIAGLYLLIMFFGVAMIWTDRTTGDEPLSFFRLVSEIIPLFGAVLIYEYFFAAKDFRGLKQKSFDGYGNYSLGLKDQLIFPEIDIDKVQKVQGMDIVFNIKSKSDKESYEFLSLMGMPFRV